MIVKKENKYGSRKRNEWFLIGSEELLNVITKVRRALEILNAENAI